MKKLSGALIAALALLVPSVAWATTASTTACDTTIGKINGQYTTVICATLCDEVIEGDTACDEYDLGPVMPDLIVLERDDSGDCTDANGPQFTFTTGPTTGGTPAFDLDTTPVVLNDTIDRLVIDTTQAVLDRYLFTAVSLATGCDTDPDVDVRIFLLYHK